MKGKFDYILGDGTICNECGHHIAPGETCRMCPIISRRLIINRTILIVVIIFIIAAAVRYL